MVVGVLGLQGSFKEHIDILSELDVEIILVKEIEDMTNIDYLIIPGGESTTISRLLKKTRLGEVIVEKVKEGLPVWGTCAGMILLGKESKGIVETLNLIPVIVERNAYGSQLDSFDYLGIVEEISKKPINLRFIRAPIISSIGDGVRVLLEVKGNIVAARKDNILVTSFHPELTNSKEVYKYFLSFK